MHEQPPPSAVMTQLLAGFQVSQALYVVAKLDICTMLDDGPLSVADLAQGSGALPQPLGRVIRALGMLGLFRTTADGRVETTPLGATLSRDHPQTQANVAEMWMEQQYLPFSDLLHTVRTGEPATEHYLGQPPFDWISADPERAALFARAMADVTGTMRTGLFDDYDLPPGKVVADIGGADGSLLAELFTSHPDRHGIVLDKPAIAPIAAEAMTARGLADRVEAGRRRLLHGGARRRRLPAQLRPARLGRRRGPHPPDDPPVSRPRFPAAGRRGCGAGRRHAAPDEAGRLALSPPGLHGGRSR